MKIINFEQLTIQDAKNNYEVLWNTFQENFPYLSDDGLSIAVSIAVDNCSTCHEENKSCQCWNDE